MKHLSLHVGQSTISAVSLGDPNGGCTLAIHGWLDNAGSMLPLAAHLPELNLVAVDLPGHGRSFHRPSGARLHFVDYVADVVAILDALSWIRCTLIGHSMGAGIAALLAGSFPDRVDKLVMLEGLGPTTTAAEEAPKRLTRALAAENERRPRVYATRAEAFERFAKARPWLSQPALERLFERALRPTTGGWEFSHDVRLKYPSILQMTEPIVLAFLAAVKCPTLVVSATRSWPHDAAQMQRRLHTLENPIHLVAQGHHHLHMDAEEPLVSALRDFLGL